MVIDMKPGRELDRLVADKVMGGPTVYEDIKGYSFIPCYSESIADAWLVVEKLRTDLDNVARGHMAPAAMGWGFRLETCTETLSSAKWEAKFPMNCSCPPFEEMNEDATAIGDTAPHAICLAALKAVGYD